jgi:hypothetical protein
MIQRELQAYGAFTLLGLFLWALSMWSGWLLARKTADTGAAGCGDGCRDLQVHRPYAVPPNYSNRYLFVLGKLRSRGET